METFCVLTGERHLNRSAVRTGRKRDLEGVIARLIHRNNAATFGHDDGGMHVAGTIVETVVPRDGPCLNGIGERGIRSIGERFAAVRLDAIDMAHRLTIDQQDLARSQVLGNRARWVEVIDKILDGRVIRIERRIGRADRVNRRAINEDRIRSIRNLIRLCVGIPRTRVRGNGLVGTTTRRKQEYKPS